MAYEYENGIGLYPVNSKGETYGANTLGYQPDLIAAVGDGNVEGYVRTTELEAVTVTGISAVPSFHKIPLYDCEGNEIGTFTMTNGVMSASELQAALSRH